MIGLGPCEGVVIYPGRRFEDNGRARKTGRPYQVEHRIPDAQVLPSSDATRSWLIHTSMTGEFLIDMFKSPVLFRSLLSLKSISIKLYSWEVDLLTTFWLRAPSLFAGFRVKLVFIVMSARILPLVTHADTPLLIFRIRRVRAPCRALCLYNG